MAKDRINEASWTTIGWQRITLQVPADWNLAGIGGDARSGYLRIDGPDRPRVEVKWDDKARAGAVNIPQTIDKYLQELRKKARKKRLDMVVEPDIKLLSKRHKRKSSLQCFSWRADVQAYGVVWYCPQCSRVTMAQVTGDLGENLKPLALDVLRTLEDHSRGDWDLWSVYALSCHIPSDFELQSQKLLTGLTQLQFARRQSRITVSRYGLADVVLKEALSPPLRPLPDRPLEEPPEEPGPASGPSPDGPVGLVVEAVGERVMDFVDRFKAPAPEAEPEPLPTLAEYLGQWCAYQQRKEWRPFRMTQEETEWQGHAAVAIRGVKWGIVDRVRNFLYRWVRFPYPMILEAGAWYCPDTNQIFMVEHLRGEQEEALWEELREGIPCHTGRD